MAKRSEKSESPNGLNSPEKVAQKLEEKLSEKIPNLNQNKQNREGLDASEILAEGLTENDSNEETSSESMFFFDDASKSASKATQNRKGAKSESKSLKGLSKGETEKGVEKSQLPSSTSQSSKTNSSKSTKSTEEHSEEQIRVSSKSERSTNNSEKKEEGIRQENQGLTPRTENQEYVVVARRYRPQQFIDLVGQSGIANALSNAIQNERIGHAYLFTGARGVGKTSAARILAKALNCEKGPSVTPCDHCDICQRIALGEDFDVLEIDGASNRGIEEVRAIRATIGTRPGRARYKIYIIDEVHMLTQQAFNALLKTLEEPPAHVKFIFATTEVQKIPITILSRCQRFDFSTIPIKQLMESLHRVIQRENRDADEDAVNLIARRANGSMRDAQSLLDQILAANENKITLEIVQNVLGIVSNENIVDLAKYIFQGDIRSAIQLVKEATEQGLQIGELLDQLIEYYRSLMLLHCQGKSALDIPFSSSQRQIIAQQAEQFSLDTILAGLEILTTCKSKMKFTSHGIVLLEMAIIRLARLEELVPLNQLIQFLKKNPGTFSGNPVSGTKGTLSTNLNSPKLDNSRIDDSKKKRFEIEANQESIPDRSNSAPLNPSDRPKQEYSEELWREIIRDVGFVLKGHLDKMGLPAIIGPNNLLIKCPYLYNAGYDYCKSGSNIQLLENLLNEKTGASNWRIKFELEPPPRGEKITELPTVAQGRKEREQQISKIPLVQKVVEVLSARLIQMDGEFGKSMLNPDGEELEPKYTENENPQSSKNKLLSDDLDEGDPDGEMEQD